MSVVNSMSKFKGIFKAYKWWDSKVSVMAVLVYYQLSLTKQIPPLGQTLLTMGLFLVATIGIAAFGHLLNDYFDIEQDQQGGVSNMVANQKLASVFARFALVLCLSWLPWFWLPISNLILALVAFEFVLFILYSIPPIRLKERGFFGTATDALYGYTIPLLVSSLVFAQFSGLVMPIWFGILLTVWTFLLGLRHIITHQLEDVTNDQIAGVNTYVIFRGWQSSFLFLSNFLLPLEMGAFLLFLLAMGIQLWIIPVGFILFAAWVLFKQSYMGIWGEGNPMRLPSIDKLFLLNTSIMSRFQTHWLPLLILATIIPRSPIYLVLAILHLMLFENGLKALRNDEFRMLLKLQRTI